MKVPVPVTARKITYPSANGAATTPSAVSMVLGSSGTTFLISPYNANDRASDSARIGGLPVIDGDDQDRAHREHERSDLGAPQPLAEEQHAEQHAHERIDEVPECGFDDSPRRHPVDVGAPVDRDRRRGRRTSAQVRSDRPRSEASLPDHGEHDSMSTSVHSHPMREDLEWTGRRENPKKAGKSPQDRNAPRPHSTPVRRAGAVGRLRGHRTAVTIPTHAEGGTNSGFGVVRPGHDGLRILRAAGRIREKRPATASDGSTSAARTAGSSAAARSCARCRAHRDPHDAGTARGQPVRLDTSATVRPFVDRRHGGESRRRRTRVPVEAPLVAPIRPSGPAESEPGRSARGTTPADTAVPGQGRERRPCRPRRGERDQAPTPGAGSRSASAMLASARAR